MMKLTVDAARKGSVIRFRGHALRVEEEPVRRGARILLCGRENRNGNPYVRRWYFRSLAVQAVEVAE